MMIVTANESTNTVHTNDAHGLVERTLNDLIAHAANRHATLSGGRFFFNIR